MAGGASSSGGIMGGGYGEESSGGGGGGFSSMVMMMNNSTNISTSAAAGTSNSRRVLLPNNLPFFIPNNSDDPSHNTIGGGGGGGQRVVAVSSSSMLKELYSNNTSNPPSGLPFMESNNTNSNIVFDSSTFNHSMKAKIMSHPHFPRLLAAYASCQKVGAPPEVVARLEEACTEASSGAAAMAGGGRSSSGCIGEDPALDQFMEAYCEMLTKYEQELTKPIKEAMLFLSRIESQFKALTVASSSSSSLPVCGDFSVRNGSPEEEMDARETYIDPQAEERELKGQLLRRYSGYLGNLKQEFLKKKKKGKLPKEARQQLLEWWSRHYKWPYPSESQKLALAESTGLDQKQINNWFINQRKRHWKPSEDMQFVVMDAAYPHHYYLDNVMGNPYPMDCAPAHL